MDPSRTLALMLIVWLVALEMIIVYRILVGQISLDGLLTTNGDDISSARLQLLIFTVLGAGASPWATPLASTSSGSVGPMLWPALLASHSVYLLAKTLRK